MDLSKLPRLSKTEQGTGEANAPANEATDGAQIPTAQTVPQQVIHYHHVEQATPGGPEAWISAAMGALLLVLNPRLIQYITSPSTFGAKWTFSDPQGQPLAYTKTVFFWGDLAITAFCVVLILDAIVLLKARSRALIAVALAITVIVVAGNLAYFLATFNTYGLSMASALAVAYGGYVAIFQWRLIKLGRGQY
jgi:hypothetical protein